MKTRRVGSITCGILLIGFGILFILHMLFPTITYLFIFRLWPLVLVALGIEMVVSNIRSNEVILKYDMGAVFLVLLLALFAMGMGIVEFCIEHAPGYWW